jgi:hypothetical protein
MRARGQWLDEENRAVDNIYFIYKIYVHNLLLAQPGEKRREEEKSRRVGTLWHPVTKAGCGRWQKYRKEQFHC